MYSLYIVMLGIDNCTNVSNATLASYLMPESISGPSIIPKKDENIKTTNTDPPKSKILPIFHLPMLLLPSPLTVLNEL